MVPVAPRERSRIERSAVCALLANLSVVETSARASTVANRHTCERPASVNVGKLTAKREDVMSASKAPKREI
jgi:hypothetical protein